MICYFLQILSLMLIEDNDIETCKFVSTCKLQSALKERELEIFQTSTNHLFYVVQGLQCYQVDNALSTNCRNFATSRLTQLIEVLSQKDLDERS